jgi:hypothetical protein
MTSEQLLMLLDTWFTRMKLDKMKVNEGALPLQWEHRL